MIVINILIGEFCAVDLRWLAHVTVRLQVSDYRQLSDYNFADQLEQNTAVYAPNDIWGNCNCYDYDSKRKKKDGLNYDLSLQFGQHIRKRLGE